MKVHDAFRRQHHECLEVRIIGFSLGLEVRPKSTESGNGKAEISIECFLQDFCAVLQQAPRFTLRQHQSAGQAFDNLRIIHR